jgi:hypothetical protein
MKATIVTTFGCATATSCGKNRTIATRMAAVWISP